MRVAADDYPADREFIDERTGAHVMITADELRVYTGARAPVEYGPDRDTPGSAQYMRYPLEKGQWVTTMSLPGGQTAVAMGVAGQPQSPGLTFSEPGTAAEFEKALSTAAQLRRRQL